MGTIIKKKKCSLESFVEAVLQEPLEPNYVTLDTFCTQSDIEKKLPLESRYFLCCLFVFNRK